MTVYQIPQWLQPSITTAIGAVVGFASAIVTDIVKTRISDKRKRAVMRKALYGELEIIYATFDATRSIPTDRAERNDMVLKVLTGISIDVYKSVKSQPEIFYGLKEAGMIDGLYLSVTTLKNHYVLPGLGTAAMEVREQFMQLFEKALSSNTLDQKLFSPSLLDDCAPPKAKATSGSV